MLYGNKEYLNKKSRHFLFFELRLLLTLKTLVNHGITPKQYRYAKDIFTVDRIFNFHYSKWTR